MASDLPVLAVQYLPVLSAEVQSSWPGARYLSTLAAQIEKETCISLKSKGCWNPRTELKTDREYGFGFGQITITAKFDNFKEIKKLDKRLRTWTWGNRYDAAYQMRAFVVYNRFNDGKLSFAATPLDRLAFGKAVYNGGLGGLLSDRAVCRATPGCDQNIWFNHVENTSKKAKLPAKGYGQSFFQINRGYVREIICVRSVKYRKAMGDQEVITCPVKVNK